MHGCHHYSQRITNVYRECGRRPKPLHRKGLLAIQPIPLCDGMGRAVEHLPYELIEARRSAAIDGPGETTMQTENSNRVWQKSMARRQAIVEKSVAAYLRMRRESLETKSVCGRSDR